MPESKRRQIVDGAYRIVFNNNNTNQFHARTNIRDRSVENVHGDANFLPNNSRTPNINVTSKFNNNSNKHSSS